MFARRQHGVVLVGALVFLLVTTLVASSMVVVHETARKREREEELLFVGMQYRRAIASYYNTIPPGGARRLPESLEVLLLDPRFPTPVVHLRRLYPDPMTGKTDWKLVQVQGGISGIRSRSEQSALKTTGFPQGLEHFKDKAMYSDWVFSVRL